MGKQVWRWYISSQVFWEAKRAQQNKISVMSQDSIYQMNITREVNPIKLGLSGSPHGATEQNQCHQSGI